MIILGCNNLSLSYGIDKILDHISFHVQESEKVGVVGVNGAGKSTLFKILSGILQPDSGEVFTARGYRTGYLQQNSGLNTASTLWDELISTYSHLVEMEGRLTALAERISIEKRPEQLSAHMKEYSLLTEKFSSSGGYEYTGKVKGVLRGLGFRDDQFSLQISALSGGQKTRLALAKLLLEEPDILLLDEPTNHLDIDAIEWLEDFLKNYGKCLLVISHDRYFLDVVTHKTVELENCECRVYNGNYSSFVKQKKLDREIQQKHYELQQKEIARMEAYIEQQRRWNREKNIIAAESRQKAIDRMEKIDRPKNLPDKIRIKFRSSIISGNDVLFVENLSKEYPGKPLFKDISFHLQRDEKVFLLGPNGCGKSTLLKILAGILDSSAGDFEYGHKIKIGYYDQEQEGLNEANTIIDEVWDASEKLTQTEIRDALASFLFKGEDVFKPVSILSGGEKSRVSLIKLMLSGANFLLLDEPTNHLDIHSREVLEESLQSFEGTLLAVSHDRYFIQKLATRVLEFSSDSLMDCRGDYAYYLECRSRWKKEMQNQAAAVSVSAAKLERLQNKEEKARQRKLTRQLEETEKEIQTAEVRLRQIDAEMLDEEVMSDHVRLTLLHEEQTRLNQRLEELYRLWETLESQVQEFQI